LNFNIYNSIILAGVIQGLLFGAIVFLSKKYKHRSVYFLTAVIVIYSLSNLQFYLNDIGLITYTELFQYYYVPWGNTVPVLLYFYVKSYLNSCFKLSRTSYYLFIPFLLSLSLSILYKIASIGHIDNNLVKGLRFYLEGFDELITALFHLIMFLVILKNIDTYKKEQATFNVNRMHLHVDWLKITFIVYSFLLVIYVALVVLDMKYPGHLFIGLVIWEFINMVLSNSVNKFVKKECQK